MSEYKLRPRMAFINELHVRNTSKGQQPTETNDVVVVYKKNYQDLTLTTVRAGSHNQIFNGKYYKNK